MTDDDDIPTGPQIEPGLLDRLHTLFQRIVAFGSLVSALYYWGRLIGYLEEGAFRFDVLPGHWQLAMACLAVLFPVAALGLWLEAAWGGVIWVVAAIGEIVMHRFLPSLFGERPLVIALYVLVVVVWVALRLGFLLRNRFENGRVTTDLP